MSFILDALKKAESERHRASGPVLVDVRLAAHRRGLPVWVWVLGFVLLANLAVLAWLMSRKPVVHEAAAGEVAAPVSAVGGAPASGTTARPAAPPPSVSGATLAGAAEPLRATTAPAPAPSQAVDPATLPTLQDLQAQGVSLPPLLLNLHVYDATPAQRFVMLNGLRLGEGDFTPDGIQVVAITEHGVVLDARGRRFMLPAGG